MSVDFSLHHLPLRPSIGDTLSSLKVSFKVDIRPGTLIDQDYAPPSADVSEPILEFWFWKKLHSQVVSAWSCPHKQRSDGRLLPPRLGIWIVKAVLSKTPISSQFTRKKPQALWTL